MISQKLKAMTPYAGDHEEMAIYLNANESFVPVDLGVKAVMMEKAAEVPLNRYPDPYATELCQGFAQYYQVPIEWVTAGNGSDEIISLLISCLLDKGSKVMTFAMDFSMYGFYSYLGECQQIVMEKDLELQVNVSDVIAKAQQEKVDMIIFSNPCNPTSMGMSRGDVIQMIEQSGALVVVDEAYMEFYDQSVLDLVGKYSNLIVLKTCSKAFAMAALRLGFAVAGPSLTTLLRTGKSPYNVNAVSQAMGSVIFEYPELLASAIGEIKASKRMLYHGLCHLAQGYGEVIKVFPSDTNFVFLLVKDGDKICQGLKAQGILVRQFGHYLRITAGTLFENDSVLSALKDILAGDEMP